uniref:Uncharacterized protein n=1 Tax=Mycena chlorophos TaxID=658473 RepID=A0ABQ0M255_MYCCL|nr:predicted protein [Mycena chlorophos]
MSDTLWTLGRYREILPVPPRRSRLATVISDLSDLGQLLEDAPTIATLASEITYWVRVARDDPPITVTPDRLLGTTDGTVDDARERLARVLAEAQELTDPNTALAFSANGET